ncbi:HAD-IIIA family hydrolase [Peribacillus sp. SCS-37]|uniref:HAD-IIIA family hydrolase n=1 Tax=Paraperibacillus esterisolvens TaxID=3115296 RepID=UPI0039067C80
MNNKIQAVFIDRDGTIGGNGHFIHPNGFELYPFSKAAFELLNQHGIRMFAYTNQHRISRGEALADEFRREFHSYGFHDAFICPHSSDENCACKKPLPGLLHEAADKHGLDLSKTVVIGDTGSTDMLAAHAAGSGKVLVQTGWGMGSLGEYRHTWQETEPDYIAKDLLEAVRWVIDRRGPFFGKY